MHHLKDGTTRVFGPDKSLMLKVKNSEVPDVPTPSGPMKATHLIEVPDGSVIKEIDAKTTQVYHNNRIIVTTINEEEKSPAPQTRSSNQWVECGQSLFNSSISADYSGTLWYVPSSPPSPHSDTINFIFNGIENYSSRNLILQPVLEWNRWSIGDEKWTITAWYATTCTSYASSSHPEVAPGYEIGGEIGYVEYSGGQYHWAVQAYDWYSSSSSLEYWGTGINPSSVSACWALEALRWVNNSATTDNMTNNDICGDVTFREIYVSYDGSPVYFTSDSWVNTAVWSGKLSGLSVSWSGITQVTMNTAN